MSFLRPQAGPKINDYGHELIIPISKEDELFHSPLCSEVFQEDYCSKNVQTIVTSPKTDKSEANINREDTVKQSISMNVHPFSKQFFKHFSGRSYVWSQNGSFK